MAGLGSYPAARNLSFTLSPWKPDIGITHQTALGMSGPMTMLAIRAIGQRSMTTNYERPNHLPTLSLGLVLLSGFNCWLCDRKPTRSLHLLPGRELHASRRLSHSLLALDAGG